MTNEQLYFSVGVPLVFNAGFIGILILLFNKRFDDMRDVWRAELHRVEEVLDARLKHNEERG